MYVTVNPYACLRSKGPIGAVVRRLKITRINETSPEPAWDIYSEPEAFYVHWVFALSDPDAGD